MQNRRTNGCLGGLPSVPRFCDCLGIPGYLYSAPTSCKTALGVDQEIECNAIRTTIVNIGLEDLLMAFPEQNQAYSSTYRFYYSELSSYLNAIVRDTRNSYIQTSTISSFFNIGITVAEIAATLLMGQGNVLTILDIYLTGNSLNQAINASHGTEATATRLRQGFVYDSTYCHGYVSTYTEYGTDSYVVSNQGSGYAWGELVGTMKELYPDSYIGNKAAYVYNRALESYGYWPYGNR